MSFCPVKLVQLLFHFHPFGPWPSLYLNHTAMPSFVMAYTYSGYVYKPFSPRRSVLTSFIELVQLLFHFHPFGPWPSLYLNHTAMPSFVMAYTYSGYVYKPFSPRRSVLTSFIELVQLLFHFHPFGPWPSLYLNHTAMPSFVMAYTYSGYVYKPFSPRRSVLTSFIELVQLLFHFHPFGPWPSLYLNHTAMPSFVM